MIDAQFLYKQGCQNKRAHGKKGDDGLHLKIQFNTTTTSTTAKTKSFKNELGVDVVAGWACGHEAVTLTHAIEFRPRWIEPVL